MSKIIENFKHDVSNLQLVIRLALVKNDMTILCESVNRFELMLKKATTKLEFSTEINGYIDQIKKILHECCTQNEMSAEKIGEAISLLSKISSR